MTPSARPNGAAIPAGVLDLVARLYTGGPPAPALHERSSTAPPQAAGNAALIVRELVEQAERDAAEALLDCLPFGILVIDGACRCNYANRAGRDALEAGEYLVLAGSAVSTVREQDAVVLSRLAAQIGKTPLPAVPDSAPIFFGRRSGHPVRVLTMPLEVAGRALLALLLPDGERSRVLRRLLARLFGLTGAEADVAVLMVEGLSIDEVARERGITLSTARSHWQTVVWKVGGGNDALLLGILQRALLLSVPPAEHGRDA